jgi:predicted RNase H-like nuclease (RuvC/YqgF family)
MNEISRTKKELAFANKQLANTKGNGAVPERYQDELANSIKIVETIGIQKKALEDENEELKSRISELIHDREEMRTQTAKKVEDSSTFYSQPHVPSLNLNRKRSSDLKNSVM